MIVTKLKSKLRVVNNHMQVFLIFQVLLSSLSSTVYFHRMYVEKMFKCRCWYPAKEAAYNNLVFTQEEGLSRLLEGSPLS